MAADLSAVGLEELPRHRLVELAKEQGLRANAKSSILIEQLAAHFADNKRPEATKKAVYKPPRPTNRATAKGAAPARKANANPGYIAASAQQASLPQTSKPSARTATKKSPAKGTKGRDASTIPADIVQLIDHDQRMLAAEAQEIAGGNAALLKEFDAKLELHKRDLLAEVEARIRAASASSSPKTTAKDLIAKQPAFIATNQPLLPPAEITKRDNTPPSPFVEAMESGTRASPSLSPRASSPGIRKRARTVSQNADVSVERTAVVPGTSTSPQAGHSRKRVRLQTPDHQVEPAAGAAAASTGARSPGIFSFFRRSSTGNQDVPPPPLSPGSRRNAPIGDLPFPLNRGMPGREVGHDNLPPMTPPANRTLFGTERDGTRFGDAGMSPSRAWFGSLLGR